MSFVVSSNPVTVEIVHLLDTFQPKEQKSIYRQLKLLKAKLLAKQLDKLTSKQVLSDQEIVDIIRNHRQTKA